MSRFKGWTAKDVERLTNKKEIPELPKLPALRKVRKPAPDYTGRISNALAVMGVPHVREYKFLHDRRFRFDIAIPEHKIAVEFEGGIWSNGRHTRGKGYARDAKKYNLATMHGWILLRYTTEDTKEPNWEFKIAEEIRLLIIGT